MAELDDQWLSILRASAEADSIKLAAARIGYSRSTVSLVLSGKYPGGTAKIRRAVLDNLSDIICPYTAKSMAGAKCARLQSRSMPTSNPSALAHWRACQSCRHKRNDNVKK